MAALRRRTLSCRLARIMLAALALTVALSAEAPARKSMLVVITDQPGRPFAQQLLEGIYEAARNREHINTFVEFMGPTALRTEQSDEDRMQLFASRYATHPIDLLIGVGDDTVPILRQLRAKHFPSARLILLVVNRRLADPSLGQADCIYSQLNSYGAAKFAVSLIPGIRRVVVLGGLSAIDEANRRNFMQELSQNPIRGVEVEFILGATLQEVPRIASGFPAGTLVVVTSNFADRSGRATNNYELVKALAAVTDAPIVEGTDISLGVGSLGGNVQSLRQTGYDIGERAMRVLERGEAPRGVVSAPASTRKVIDARQFKRLGIPLSKVPAGYEILHRELSFWEAHQGKILTGLAILLLQTLLISFLIAERRRRARSQIQMERRLTLEAAASRAAAVLSAAEPAELASSLQAAAGEMGEKLGAEWLVIIQCEGPGAIRKCYGWPGPPPDLPVDDVNAFPFLNAELADGREVTLSLAQGCPNGAARDCLALKGAGLGCVTAAPLTLGEKRKGILAAAARVPSPLWPGEAASALRMLASLVEQSIGRVAAEEKERLSEERNRAMLASLPGLVAMIDAQGQILQLSDATGLCGGEFPPALAEARKGHNLLELWRSEPAGGVVARAIERVIVGAAQSRPTEFQYEASNGQRWLEVRVERLQHAETGAVVSHVDITSRKLAERENSLNRETISHLNRVAALGELTASLAHEINQPLAGILNSAEAAALLLAQPVPDLAEAREAIRDIIDDDSRAAAVIRKMRSMLKRGEEPLQPVPLDVTIKETLRFLAHEARLRRVSLEMDVARGLAAAAAEPIKLQQVLVNLITNAIDSLEDQPSALRRVLVSAFRPEDSAGMVLTVKDTGPGIPAALLPSLFTPFVTSKAKGLGLGLSICRSIVESFGGRIHAANSPDGGGHFTVELLEWSPDVPLAVAPAVAAAFEKTRATPVSDR